MMSAESEWEGWRPSRYACPDCSGVLWERPGADPPSFRCRIGHAFDGDALQGAKADELETALWSAVNTLEEQADLSERLQARARERGRPDSAARYLETARRSREQVRSIREFLASAFGMAAPVDDPGRDAEAVTRG